MAKRKPPSYPHAPGRLPFEDPEVPLSASGPQDPPDPTDPAAPPDPKDPVDPRDSSYPSQRRWREPSRSLRVVAWLKRFAKLWGFALFCLFVVYLFRTIALPFVFAILVAYLLAPVVDRMARFEIAGKRVPRGAAVIALYIVILSFLGVGIGFVVPRLSGDFARLFREAPALFAKVNGEYLPKVGAWVDRHFGPGDEEGVAAAALPVSAVPEDTFIEPLADGRYRLQLGNLADRFALEIRPGDDKGTYVVAPLRAREPERITGGRWERSIKKWLEEKVQGTENETRRALEYGQKFVTAVVGGLWKLTLVLMLAAFILIDLQRVRGFIRSLVPENYRRDYDRIARGIDRGLSGVIRGQLTICVVNGILTYIGLLIFKVKYPLLLSGIATVMSLIPIFGSFLSSVPIVAIAIVSGGEFDPMVGLYIVGWIVMIHLLEANFLNPKILGTAARIHPVLVVFALVAGEHTYGLIGALFAVPVLSIVQTVFLYLRRNSGQRSAATTGEDPLVNLP